MAVNLPAIAEQQGFEAPSLPSVPGLDSLPGLGGGGLADSSTTSSAANVSTGAKGGTFLNFGTSSQSSGNNTMMYIIAGLAALFILKKK